MRAARGTMRVPLLEQVPRTPALPLPLPVRVRSLTKHLLSIQLGLPGYDIFPYVLQNNVKSERNDSLLRY